MTPSQKIKAAVGDLKALSERLGNPLTLKQEVFLRKTAANALPPLLTALEEMAEALEFYSQPGMAVDPSDIEYAHSEAGFTSPHSGKRARTALARAAELMGGE